MCLTGDPRLIDADRWDIRLGPFSPAVDAGPMHGIFTFFKDLYGLSLANDLIGISRPTGFTFDLGAFERPGF